MPDFASMQPVYKTEVMPQSQLTTNMGMPNLAPGGSTTPSISPTGPTYADVIAQLNGAKTAGNDTFNTGISNIKGQITSPDAPLDPAYQKMIDNIRANASYYGGQMGSAASALSLRRGVPGSSIEQFGVQTALNNVNRTAADQTAQVYLQNLQRQQSLKDSLVNAFTTRAGQQTTQGTSLGTTGANLTSDEIASQRNMAMYQQQLQLQQQLGLAGINQAQSNTDAASRNATNAGLFKLGGALISAGTLGSAGGAGGAGGASGTGLFNMGVGPASPGLFGPGGALFNTAGTSALGAGNILPGAAGMLAGQAAFGNNRYTNTGAVIGGIGGSLFGPLGTAAGSFIGSGLGGLSNQAANQVSNKLGNTAGSVLRYSNPLTAIPDAGAKVSNAIKSVFRF